MFEKKSGESVEHKSVVTEFKASADGTFEGYASVFGNKDSYGDIVRPGAYTKTLQERGGKVKVLFNHDPNQLIGKPVEMKEDTYGLFVRAQIITSLTMGKEVLEMMRNGLLTEMSIGYTAIKYNYLKPESESDYWPGRELLEVKLYEFSPVTFAANESATITQVKNSKDLAEQVRFWTLIAEADFKAGRVLNKQNAQKLLEAYQKLGEVLETAGVNEAAESTSDTEEAKGRKPGQSTSALAELKAYRQNLEQDSKREKISAELRHFHQGLKEA